VGAAAATEGTTGPAAVEKNAGAAVIAGVEAAVDAPTLAAVPGVAELLAAFVAAGALTTRDDAPATTVSVVFVAVPDTPPQAPPPLIPAMEPIPEALRAPRRSVELSPLPKPPAACQLVPMVDHVPKPRAAEATGAAAASGAGGGAESAGSAPSATGDPPVVNIATGARSGDDDGRVRSTSPMNATSCSPVNEAGSPGENVPHWAAAIAMVANVSSMPAVMRSRRRFALNRSRIGTLCLRNGSTVCSAPRLVHGGCHGRSDRSNRSDRSRCWWT
jgi:hypothetical protein